MLNSMCKPSECNSKILAATETAPFNTATMSA
jgi:hypothetical protein